MSYSRVNWKDYPDKTTPVSAANLNKMDEGIYNNAEKIAANEEAIANIETSVSDLSSNLSLDYSNVSSDVQDLNTFLQKALEKLFPQSEVFPFSNNWEWAQSVSLSATTLIELISDVDITITVECAVYYYSTVYLGNYAVLTKNGTDLLNYLTKTQVANHGGYKYIGEITLNKNDVIAFGTTAMTKTGSSINECKFAYIDVSIA